MAKSSNTSQRVGVEDEASGVGAAAASGVASSEPGVAAATAGGESSPPASAAKHSQKARFCIKPAKDNPDGEDEFTDNVHVAYAAFSRGQQVIDHEHGNRNYDGTVPKAKKA